jgi:methyl-accepting chemotaxis protein
LETKIFSLLGAFMERWSPMRSTIERLGSPALALYAKHDLKVLSYATAIGLGSCFVAKLALPASWQWIVVLPALSLLLYFMIGFNYLRGRNVDAGSAIIDRAMAGDWQLSKTHENDQFAKNGVVGLITSYVDSVKRLADETARTAEDLLDGSKLASNDANQLSERAEEIAAMLEETAAGLEEFTASIERNAQNAKEVSDIAKCATEAAYDGADQVSAINNSVSETGKKSQRVLQIIELIEGFAAQTSMLSLNASIEAARAGQHGRGFTQVADEVRELSERSSEAAKLIRERILSASRQVQQGMNTANESSKILEDVLTQVSQAQELIDDVAGASTEQSAGVAQIKLAVEHMATLTQQNASAVDQVAKLAGSLEKDAFTLDQHLVGIKASRLSSRQSCMAWARSACDYVGTVGIENAAREFSRKGGKFHRDDLFIVVTRADGLVVAHGGEPQLIGTNAMELRDANGLQLVKEQARIVRAHGHGWIDYNLRNPATGKPSIKHTFVIAIPNIDYWISCGVFSEIRENTGIKPVENVTALRENS